MMEEISTLYEAQVAVTLNGGVSSVCGQGVNRWVSLDDDEALLWKQMTDKDKCSYKSEEADASSDRYRQHWRKVSYLETLSVLGSLCSRPQLVISRSCHPLSQHCWTRSWYLAASLWGLFASIFSWDREFLRPYGHVRPRGGLNKLMQHLYLSIVWVFAILHFKKDQ